MSQPAEPRDGELDGLSLMTPPGLGAALGVLLAALVVRLAPMLATDFPLNDGALFLAMTLGILDNGWIPPATVAWNGNDIPLAYPPLGFYLTGTLNAAGIDHLVLMRWLPVAFATVAAGGVFLVGQRFIGSTAGGLFAGLTYAFAPAAFQWPINGGGITRAPGIAFAILAVWLFLRLLDRPSTRAGIMLGAAVGLTALFHPGAAVFLGASILVLTAGRRDRFCAALGRMTRSVAVAIATAGLLVLPWLSLVVARHSPEVLLGVSSNGPHPLLVAARIIGADVTGALHPDPLAAAMLAVAVLRLARGDWLLPAWWVAASLISFQYGIVPASLLIGAVASDLWSVVTARQASARAVARAGVAALSALLLIEGWTALSAADRQDSHLHALDADRRAAMRWTAENTPAQATTAVVSGATWPVDADSEWFYLLTNRVSTATVQGSEWLGAGALNAFEHRSAELQRCADEGGTCVVGWLEVWPADYVYIPKGRLHGPNSPSDCCAAVRDDLRTLNGFAVVYDGPGATIYRTPQVSSP